MSRRLLLLAASLVLTVVAAPIPGTPISRTACDECVAHCNQIPMDPQECLQLYCPECADATTTPIGGTVG